MAASECERIGHGPRAVVTCMLCLWQQVGCELFVVALWLGMVRVRCGLGGHERTRVWQSRGLGCLVVLEGHCISCARFWSAGRVGYRSARDAETNVSPLGRVRRHASSLRHASLWQRLQHFIERGQARGTLTPVVDS